MFSEATSFNQPIGNWDVSQVTDMDQMFWGATAFNQPLNNWDVSKVTNMTYMFACIFDYDMSFNQPIGNWNVSSVTNMGGMFENSRSFNQNISNWDVSNVTNMNSMFYDSSFNQPIGNWDVSNVTNMNSMFYDSSFNQPIGNWDVSSVINMSNMFYGAEAFCQNISAWRRPGWPHIYLMGFRKNYFGSYLNGMFDGAKAFNNVYDRYSLKRKIPLSEAIPNLDSTLKKNISKLKKLFKKRDYTSIDVGIHLMKSLGEKVLYEYFLNEVKIHENGEFVRSKYFTGSGPAQPFLDYILLSLINNAPSKANIDESIKRTSIKRIFLEAEYPYHTGDQYWSRDCGIYTANQLPDLAFENLEEITLSNYINIESLKFLLNCKKLININITNLGQIKDAKIFSKGIVKNIFLSHNNITPRN